MSHPERRPWVSPWWQAINLPDRWDVCGVIVPSLSVWHVFALENIGNAFVVGGVPTMDDVQGLLLIASRDMQGGRRLLSHDRHRARMTRRMYLRLRKADESDAITACREYVSECMRHGHRMSTAGVSGTPAGSPEPWAIVAVLAGLMDWQAAWNAPYAVGRAALDAHDERNGNTTMTPWSYGEEMHDNWEWWEQQTETREVSLN